MSKDRQQEPPDPSAELERDIRQVRKFSSKEALARLAGPGAMKGASPVSRVQQAEMEIGSWLRSHIVDPQGILPIMVSRDLHGSELLLNNVDQPLVALAAHCRALLRSDYLLAELVRQADVEWGRRMDERPHFERADSASDPNDPYTLVSVTTALQEIVQQLPAAAN